MAISADLDHFWRADKELSIDPDWHPRDREEFARLTSPLDIDGVTIEGLRFTCLAHIYTPDRNVTFQIEYSSRENPRGAPFVRFEWLPLSPHSNKGLGPPEYRHKILRGTHIHPFELNWEHSQEQVRKGQLRIAVPVPRALEKLRRGT